MPATLSVVKRLFIAHLLVVSHVTKTKWRHAGMHERAIEVWLVEENVVEKYLHLWLALYTTWQIKGFTRFAKARNRGARRQTVTISRVTWVRPLVSKTKFLQTAKISPIFKEAEVLPRRLPNFSKANNFVFFLTIKLSE